MKLLRDGLPIGVIGAAVLIMSGPVFVAAAAQAQEPAEIVGESESETIEEKLRKLEQQGP